MPSLILSANVRKNVHGLYHARDQLHLPSSLTQELAEALEPKLTGESPAVPPPTSSHKDRASTAAKEVRVPHKMLVDLARWARVNSTAIQEAALGELCSARCGRRRTNAERLSPQDSLAFCFCRPDAIHTLGAFARLEGLYRPTTRFRTCEYDALELSACFCLRS